MVGLAANPLASLRSLEQLLRAIGKAAVHYPLSKVFASCSDSNEGGERRHEHAGNSHKTVPYRTDSGAFL